MVYIFINFFIQVTGVVSKDLLVHVMEFLGFIFIELSFDFWVWGCVHEVFDIKHSAVEIECSYF